MGQTLNPIRKHLYPTSAPPSYPRAFLAMLIIIAMPWFTVVSLHGGAGGGGGVGGGDGAGDGAGGGAGDGSGDGGDFFTGIRTQPLGLSHVDRRLIALQESSWPSA